METNKTKELEMDSANDGNSTTWRCCICGEEFPVYCVRDAALGYVPTTIGMNNPWPITPEPYGEDGETHCCNDCNGFYVITARLCLNDPDAMFTLAHRMYTAGCTQAAITNVLNLSLEA